MNESAGTGSDKGHRRLLSLKLRLTWLAPWRNSSSTGKTVATQHPSNEILIQDGEKKWPAPELVYRRMHFFNGVPHEYAWATSDERIRKSGGLGIQRMTVDTWLELIEKERALGTGHILPCGGNLPRPEERGGCDCAVCAGNRAILEKRAAA